MIRSFKSSAEFRTWLSKNGTFSKGLWVQIYKKDSGAKSISYSEALDEALCFGWIDGQKKALDELSWLQRFCPRRPRSTWSKVNVRNVERLIETGRMTTHGLREVALAKADGRWETAYDSQKTAKLPPDFLKLLAKNKKAHSFFKTLNKANVYAIVYRLQTAKKPETRERRLKLILEMLSRGEKFHGSASE